MTKSEFVVKLAEKAGLTKADAEKAVNAFLETVSETLKSGEKVAFTGFGSFENVRLKKPQRAPSHMTVMLDMTDTADGFFFTPSSPIVALA